MFNTSRVVLLKAMELESVGTRLGLPLIRMPWSVTPPPSSLRVLRTYLLGLIAVAAVFLPLSQNARADWGYYHHYYGYHHASWHHRYWHHGYWYDGLWHPGYWYPGPVTVVVAPN